MSEFEQQLAEVAAGTSWRLSRLSQMTAATQGMKHRVEKVDAEIHGGAWTGYAADTASAHLSATAKTLQNATDWLEDVSQLIERVNSSVVELANAKLASLPSGNLPTAVMDAFSQGKFETLAVYGLSAVSKGPTGLAQLDAHFADERERAAQSAWNEVKDEIARAAETLKNKVEVGFDHVEPVLPPPPPEGPQLGGPDSGFDGNGPGAGGTPPGFGTQPSSGGNGPGVGGPAGQDPTLTTNPPVHPDPNNPDWPGDRDTDWPPIVTDPPPYDPNRPDGPGGNSGVDPEWNDPGRRPSVDSNLDGSTLRSGLGAAGLGAAGLAAGAKLAGAGGSGSGLGLGGAGQGVFGVGGAGGAGGAGLGGSGGLRGAASAAPSGSGSAAGSSNSSGGARGGRPGGMMGGGGGGGGTEKKSARSGLGYIAPKLEDEGDGGPAARASRAGGRVPEE